MKRFMVSLGMGLFGFVMTAGAETFGHSDVAPNRHRVGRPPVLSGDVSGLPGATAVYPGDPVAGISWHESMDSGWAEARRRDVPMVIFITSERCTYCDAMKRTTWSDIGISQRLSKEFVAIRLTPQKNQKELSRIKVDTYPTTLIGLPEGKIADHRIGYQPAAAIHGLLSEAKQISEAKARQTVGR